MPGSRSGDLTGEMTDVRARAPRRAELAQPELALLRAERLEQTRGLTGAAVLALLGTVLLVLGALPLGRAQLFRDNGYTGPGPWAGSLTTLILLTVALQLAVVLLAVEHWATRLSKEGEAPRRRGFTVVWLMRGLILTAVALAVLVGWVVPWFWERPGWVALGGQLVALVAFVWANANLGHLLGPEQKRREDRLEQESAFGETQELWIPTASGDVGGEPTRDVVLEDSHQLLAIGASGGGIRATAFVLGGHQAVQSAAVDLMVSGDSEEPHVFSVSGGSYIAAALALRRTYDETGSARSGDDPERAWGSAYSMDSPELERLRRHTRYLFEPASRALDGAVALITGAVVNLVLVAVLLRMVAWLSVTLGVTVTFVSTRAAACDQPVGLGLACGWGLKEWLWLLAPTLALLLATGVVTVRGWRSTKAFDDGDVGDMARAGQRLSVAETLRPRLLLLAAVWLVLSVGLPGAAVGVSRMVTANQPTNTVAGLLHSAGFATRKMCVDAFETNVAQAVDVANNQARISPGTRREVSAGACGVETTVVRTVDAKGTADTADDIVLGANGQAARDLIGYSNVAGPATGVGALLTVVLMLLRRGPTPEANASARWWSRLKRVLLTWLPLIIVGTIALYAVLIWSFGLIVNMDTDYRGITALVAVGGLTLGFLVDANATSMHGFYRTRLADAFAATVGRDGRARSLPSEKVYRFSDMAVRDGVVGPRLHIVATLNSQKPNEAPTMRGGFPLVFGPEEVSVYREEGTRVVVPTPEYEEFAGSGRVSVMAAVAISGAAISPLMGRFAVQMTPYRLLLALFNLRIGSWVRNPMHAGAVTPSVGWDSWMWMTRHPGLFNVAAEGMGSTSADERWIYLSDGGHLDNTGMVECVRHCVVTKTGGRVLVLDASNDPVDSWAAAGDAVAVIRSDLNLDLQRTDLKSMPPWARHYQAPGLDVVVCKAVRTPDPTLTDDTRWWDQLPPNVQSFQLVNKEFPRSSTARQKFGDIEFEAYRGLGFACVTSALQAAGWSTLPAID
ncbi:MAG: hypothetical protein ABIN79_04580 [Marmoricola sp.]